MSTPYQYMPPLSDEEYAALRDDIRVHGIQTPIVVDENGLVIDGHHRQAIAAELGIDCPTEAPAGLSDSEKRSQSFSRNLVRRHLNRDQRRQVIAESLLADPQLSDREHARRTGSSHPTVAKIRHDLEANGRLESFASRVSADGRTRPAVGMMTREEAEAHTRATRQALEEFWDSAAVVAVNAEQTAVILANGINDGWPQQDGFDSAGDWLAAKHFEFVQLCTETMRDGYAEHLLTAMSGGYGHDVTIYGAEIRAAVLLGFVDNFRVKADREDLTEAFAPICDSLERSVTADLNSRMRADR